MAEDVKPSRLRSIYCALTGDSMLPTLLHGPAILGGACHRASAGVQRIDLLRGSVKARKGEKQQDRVVAGGSSVSPSLRQSPLFGPRRSSTLFWGSHSRKMARVVRHHIFPQGHRNSMGTRLPSKRGHRTPSVYEQNSLVATRLSQGLIKKRREWPRHSGCLALSVHHRLGIRPHTVRHPFTLSGRTGRERPTIWPC